MKGFFKIHMANYHKSEITKGVATDETYSLSISTHPYLKNNKKSRSAEKAKRDPLISQNAFFSAKNVEKV